MRHESVSLRLVLPLVVCFLIRRWVTVWCLCVNEWKEGRIEGKSKSYTFTISNAAKARYSEIYLDTVETSNRE